MKIFRFLLLAALGLAACTAQPTAPASVDVTPLPAFGVALPAELNWLGAELNACAQQTRSGVYLLPPGADADVQITWGTPPEEGYAAQLGTASIAVIVHPAQPLDEIGYGQFQAIFTGQVQTWGGDVLPDGGPAGEAVQVWLPSAGWYEGLFGQAPRGDAWLSVDPVELVAQVAADPRAIGLIPAAWLNDQVKPLSLTDFPAQQVSRPLVAVTATEPQGALRDWIACLAEKTP